MSTLINNVQIYELNELPLSIMALEIFDHGDYSMTSTSRNGSQPMIKEDKFVHLQVVMQNYL